MVRCSDESAITLMPHFWRCSVCQRDVPTAANFCVWCADPPGWIERALMHTIAQKVDLEMSGLPLHRAAFDLGYTERDRIFLKQLRIQP